MKNLRVRPNSPSPPEVVKHAPGWFCRSQGIVRVLLCCVQINNKFKPLIARLDSKQGEKVWMVIPPQPMGSLFLWLARVRSHPTSGCC